MRQPTNWLKNTAKSDYSLLNMWYLLRSRFHSSSQAFLNILLPIWAQKHFNYHSPHGKFPMKCFIDTKKRYWSKMKSVAMVFLLHAYVQCMFCWDHISHWKEISLNTSLHAKYWLLKNYFDYTQKLISLTKWLDCSVAIFWSRGV